LNEITTGIETADVIAGAAGGPLSQLERMVWEYSREMISDFLIIRPRLGCR